MENIRAMENVVFLAYSLMKIWVLSLSIKSECSFNWSMNFSFLVGFAKVFEKTRPIPDSLIFQKAEAASQTSSETSFFGSGSRWDCSPCVLPKNLWTRITPADLERTKYAGSMQHFFPLRYYHGTKEKIRSCIIISLLPLEKYCQLFNFGVLWQRYCLSAENGLQNWRSQVGPYLWDLDVSSSL